MSSKLFEVNGIEVWSNDIVRLTNGMCVGIVGVYSSDEDKMVCVYTHPISSIHSSISQKYITEVVARFDDDHSQMQWFFDTHNQNPLRITDEDIEKNE